MRVLYRSMLLLVWLLPLGADASILQMWFDEPFQVAAPGTVVDFTGTVRNDSGARVFINGDALNLFQPESWSWQNLAAQSRVLYDAPLYLDHGEEWSGTLIRVEVGLGAEGGRQHFGNLTILGGADGGAQVELADANFGLEVAPVPEPMTLLLGGAGVALALRRRSKPPACSNA